MTGALMYGRWSKDDRGYDLTDCCGRRADQYGGVAAALGGPRQLDGGYCPAETYETGKEGDARLTYAAGCSTARSAFPHVFRRLGLHPVRLREVRL